MFLVNINLLNYSLRFKFPACPASDEFLFCIIIIILQQQQQIYPYSFKAKQAIKPNSPSMLNALILISIRVFQLQTGTEQAMLMRESTCTFLCQNAQKTVSMDVVCYCITGRPSHYNKTITTILMIDRLDCLDWQTDKQTDGWTDKQTDGQTDR